MAVLEAPSLERNVELGGARYRKQGSVPFVPSAPAGILCSARHSLRRVYSDLSFIAFTLALTSFFTRAIGASFPAGKLTMAFVVA